MSDIVKLPYSVTRRVHARKPRRSKNGTPAERVTRQQAKVVKFKAQANSPAAMIDAANENERLAAMITWPDIPAPRDFSQSDDELGTLDFDAIPEFRPDGIGAGTPEFREQLDAYFHTIMVASRWAFAMLGHSRSEMAAIVSKGDDYADQAVDLAKRFARGHDDLVRLARYLKAAEVRQVCAIASSDVEMAEPSVGDAPSPDAA